jgi:hypothetical protein
VSYTVRYFWIGDSTTSYTVTTPSSPVTLTGLRVNGASYRVAVMSHCAGGYTTSSPWVSLLMGSSSGGGTGSTCAPPTNVTVATTSTTATLSFAAVSGAGSYRVIYYAVGDSINSIMRTVSGSPVTLTGLLPNTPYIVRIFSSCSGATSAAALVTLRTQAVPAPCGAVSNVVVTATSASSATVSFTPGINNTRFTVTYSVPNDSARWVTSNASPVAITGLVPGRTYTIQVQSACGAGTTVTYTAGAPVTYSFRGVLGVRHGFSSGALELYPNPAHRAANLVLPAVPGATQARLLLLNGLGQQVRLLAVPLVGAETRANLDLSGVAPGLYTLRIAAGGQVVSQRLAVE